MIPIGKRWQRPREKDGNNDDVRSAQDAQKASRILRLVGNKFLAY